MLELRKDPVLGHWVSVAASRAGRPFQIGPGRQEPEETENCPFDEGSEAQTPPEVAALRRSGSKPDGPGWQIRVFPNRFPALSPGETLEPGLAGMYEKSGAVGFHEVVVETPDHRKDLSDLSPEEIAGVLRIYRERMLAHRQDSRIQSVIVFKNVGWRAGATLAHSHSQLLALPIVPKKLSDELEGARSYFEARGQCVYCDILRQERASDERSVFENDAFFVFSPFWARFPFECWVIPKKHASDFGRIGEKEIPLLASAFKLLLSRLREVLRNPSYNLLIHTAPPGPDHEKSFHWHLEAVPRLGEMVGFEWGTGFYINPVPPEKAALLLRRKT